MRNVITHVWFSFKRNRQQNLKATGLFLSILILAFLPIQAYQALSNLVANYQQQVGVLMSVTPNFSVADEARTTLAMSEYQALSELSYVRNSMIEGSAGLVMNDQQMWARLLDKTVLERQFAGKIAGQLPLKRQTCLLGAEYATQNNIQRNDWVTIGAQQVQVVGLFEKEATVDETAIYMTVENSEWLAASATGQLYFLTFQLADERFVGQFEKEMHAMLPDGYQVKKEEPAALFKELFSLQELLLNGVIVSVLICLLLFGVSYHRWCQKRWAEMYTLRLWGMPVKDLTLSLLIEQGIILLGCLGGALVGASFIANVLLNAGLQEKISLFDLEFARPTLYFNETLGLVWAKSSSRWFMGLYSSCFIICGLGLTSFHSLNFRLIAFHEGRKRR